MTEFTERHHAFLAASFYTQLTDAFGQRGEAAFVLATQRYAEQRGSRMAQGAIRDGMPLTFATYRTYGEWVNTKTVTEENCQNQGCVESFSPDYIERITQCPWAIQFKEMGVIRGGTVYCTHLDRAIVRGFNPYLVFEVPQSMHESDCCIQISRNAGFAEGQTFQKRREYLKGFDYHCGHCFKTFREVSTAIFGKEGSEAAAQVLERFGNTYGNDMAEVVAGFQYTDFNLI